MRLHKGDRVTFNAKGDKLFPRSPRGREGVVVHEPSYQRGSGYSGASVRWDGTTGVCRYPNEVLCRVDATLKIEGMFVVFKSEVFDARAVS